MQLKHSHTEVSLLKSFNRAVDRFCYRHPKFGIRNLMLCVVIGCAIVYIISLMDRTGTFTSYLAFSPALIFRGQLWRLVSFILIPGFGGLIWTAVGLYFYYFIGSTLEREWGPGRFTLYYACGVVFYLIYGFIFYFIKGYAPHLDPMYLNFSMFFAFALLFPETQVLLFFFIPIKIKYIAWVMAALFVYWLVRGDLLTVVAVLNLLLFCGEYMLQSVRSIRRTNAASGAFRQKMRKAAYSASQQPYTHKCAVCGRTDTDYPDLEFRYCSRCMGYRCFCADHINSHVHFTSEDN